MHSPRVRGVGAPVSGRGEPAPALLGGPGGPTPSGGGVRGREASAIPSHPGPVRAVPPGKRQLDNPVPPERRTAVGLLSALRRPSAPVGGPAGEYPLPPDQPRASRPRRRAPPARPGRGRGGSRKDGRSGHV